MFFSSVISTLFVIPMQKISTPAFLVRFAFICVFDASWFAFPSVIRKAIFLILSRAPSSGLVSRVRTSTRDPEMFVSPPSIIILSMAASTLALVVYWFRLKTILDLVLNSTTPILVKSGPIGKDRTMFFVKFLILSKLV